VLIVGSLLGKSESGQYGAASQVAAMVHFAVTAVIFIITPAIAALFAQQRLDTLRRLIRGVVTVSILLSAPVVLLLALAGRWLLSLYGDGFVAAYPTLLLLCVNQFVAASVGTLAGTIMSMTGKQREAARIIGVSALLNLVLSVLLTPRFGLSGAATATLTATMVRSIFLVRYLRRELALVLLPGRRLLG
jgi:O-antigen/teichoic acid export membrane protein